MFMGLVGSWLSYLVETTFQTISAEYQKELHGDGIVFVQEPIRVVCHVHNLKSSLVEHSESAKGSGRCQSPSKLRSTCGLWYDKSHRIDMSDVKS
jgi:hypothetical protein